MGLASALSTALTGLTAAETTIDLVGNNLANSNTVGFKASQVTFATQFLQTQSLGSAPSASSGGTNPRQIGLGTMVADITPNFNQGTIEISSNPTDLAIQGDGFFVVQGRSGDELYTRNGILKMNSENRLVTVTGNYLLGYGVDSQYQIKTDSNTLQPLEIPLGAAAVAKATENVYLEGTLTPTGDLATAAEIIQTGALVDGRIERPDLAAAGTQAETNTAPASNQVNRTAVSDPAGNVGSGTYTYRMVYADAAYGTPSATEGYPTAATASVTVDNVGPPATNAVQLDTWPVDADYQYIRFYRSTVADPAQYYYVGEKAMGDATPLVDTKADAAFVPSELLSTDVLASGDYTYYVTFAKTQGLETSPSEPIAANVPVSGSRVHLLDLPQADPAEWDVMRVYRSLANDYTVFYQVAEIPAASGLTDFTDQISDAQILADIAADPDSHPTLNQDYPPIDKDTPLLEVLRRDGSQYGNVFQEGTLAFTGRKGGRELSTKDLAITGTTTVSDLLSFMEQALGIQKVPGADPNHPIPSSTNPTPGQPDLNPGGSVVDGHIRLVGNNGTANAIDIALSGMQLITPTGQSTVNVPFAATQTAVGESAVADFMAYDSLGIPVNVRLTTVLESRDSTSTTYRWFADSPDNSPASGVSINVGTGLISFDGEGNFTSTTEKTVSISRTGLPSVSPLEFELDFNQISGLAADASNLAVSRQDGSSEGKLTSFIVGEDGLIRGVFSNGITRDLGQIVLARFSNPSGLEQKGENLYASGVNSGLPMRCNPGQRGAGSIIAGAVELSNTDIGGNLIDLILASTMYRGNTRVITTVQQMLDELLLLRR